MALLVFSVARRVVVPAQRPADTEILAVDTGAQTIELARTADTELPGRYGLFTSGTHGYVKLGAVLSADATTVRRKLLTQIEPGARVDRPAAFSGWYYASPGELHLPWENVLIDAPAGACPAWFFPTGSSTWVIQIHGRGVMRAECLRAVPAMHAAGLSSLVVSYRNDGEAPRTRRGAYSLGAEEWRDVDAAIAHAVRHGAERVILMGWSMGGAVALQAAVNSEHRDRIAGLILESPVIDWRSVLRFQAKAAGMRAPLPDLAMRALSQPLTARLSGAEDAIPFDRLDMVTRAEELSVPMLILHSDDDGFVPADASHALHDARPDLVTMPRFSVARHTKIWNYDQAGWTAAIDGWLRAQRLSASA
nr:alpha/beta fold hydrolase [uncultured Microbacterium sp.]